MSAREYIHPDWIRGWEAIHARLRRRGMQPTAKGDYLIVVCPQIYVWDTHRGDVMVDPKGRKWSVTRVERFNEIPQGMFVKYVEINARVYGTPVE